jgi:hypothetical protein
MNALLNVENDQVAGALVANAFAKIINGNCFNVTFSYNTQQTSELKIELKTTKELVDQASIEFHFNSNSFDNLMRTINTSINSESIKVQKITRCQSELTNKKDIKNEMNSSLNTTLNLKNSNQKDIESTCDKWITSKKNLVFNGITNNICLGNKIPVSPNDKDLWTAKCKEMELYTNSKFNDSDDTMSCITKCCIDPRSQKKQSHKVTKITDLNSTTNNKDKKEEADKIRRILLQKESVRIEKIKEETDKIKKKKEKTDGSKRIKDKTNIINRGKEAKDREGANKLEKFQTPVTVAGSKLSKNQPYSTQLETKHLNAKIKSINEIERTTYVPGMLDYDETKTIPYPTNNVSYQNNIEQKFGYQKIETQRRRKKHRI